MLPDMLHSPVTLLALMSRPDPFALPGETQEEQPPSGFSSVFFWKGESDWFPKILIKGFFER